MSKSDPELKGIVGWVVRAGYSELRKMFRENGIISVYANLKNDYSIGSFNGGPDYKITFDRTLEDVPKNIKIGVCARECEHLSEKLQFNREDIKIDQQLRKFDPYCEKHERNTDLNVVLRGFGKELLEFRHFAEFYNGEKNSEFGLSSKELEKLLKVQQPF